LDGVSSHAAPLFHRSSLTGSGSRLPPLPLLPSTVSNGFPVPHSALPEAPPFDAVNMLSPSFSTGHLPLIAEPGRNFADSGSEQSASWDQNLGSLHDLAGICQNVDRLSRVPIEVYDDPAKEEHRRLEAAIADFVASSHFESKANPPAVIPPTVIPQVAMPQAAVPQVVPFFSEPAIVIQESTHSNVEETKTTPCKRKRKPRLKEDPWVSPSIKGRRPTKKKHVSPVPGSGHEASVSPSKPLNSKKLINKARGNTHQGRSSRHVLGKEEYVCQFKDCAKVFPKPSALERHLRTHTGERPFVCLFADCGLSFSERGNLKRHQRVHTGEKPYVCEYVGCNTSFARKSHLIQHENTRHDGFQSESSRSKQRRKSSSDPYSIADLREYDLTTLLGMALLSQGNGSNPPSSPVPTGTSVARPPDNLPPPVIIQPQDEPYTSRADSVFSPEVSQSNHNPPFSEMLKALDAIHSNANLNTSFSTSQPLPSFEYGDSLRTNAPPIVFEDMNGSNAFPHQQLVDFGVRAEPGTFSSSLHLGSLPSLPEPAHAPANRSALPSLDFLSATFGHGVSDAAGSLPQMRPDPLAIIPDPLPTMSSESFPSMRLAFPTSLEGSPSMDFSLSQDSCVSAFSTTSIYNGSMMTEGLPPLDLSSWSTTPNSSLPSQAQAGVSTIQPHGLVLCSSPDLGQHDDNRSTLLLSPLLSRMGDTESDQPLP